MTTERIRLRIGDMGKAVLITGQAYQDPKDALNEFVSNAADEYAQTDRRAGRIRVFLRRKGRRTLVAVEDDGRGLDEERLRQIARNLFNSSKTSDPRTIGEKAIGILAFQQLGSRCDIVTRPEGSDRTLALKLERGSPRAELDPNERRRARQQPGTTVYVLDLDPDVARVLTQRKVVDYLRRRRAAALARGDYQIEVIEGRQSELVTPDEPDGVRLDLPPRQTLWGRIEFALYVAPRPDKPRSVSVVGAGGTTIIDSITEVEEFDGPPWSTNQLSGMVAFEALRQSAGRRAILREPEAFPVFLEAVRSIEPAVLRTLERVAREVDVDMTERLNDAVRRIFSRVLKELADLDNPMRTAMGSEPGQGALLEEPASGSEAAPAGDEGPGGLDELAPRVDDLLPKTTNAEEIPPEQAPTARPSPGRGKPLPTIAPDPSPDGARSRFDPDAGVVFYNDGHPDYLMVKEDSQGLLDYLSTLVAKEYVVYNNPRAAPDDIAEEMVRMLVRVRRHLPKKL